jgi:hypothetical protein
LQELAMAIGARIVRLFDSTASSAPVRAIEVHALFEDAIVEVAHLSNPTAGATTALTRALVGGGAAAVGLAFVGFFRALAEVARIHRAWEAWDSAGNPHNAFALPPDNGSVFDGFAAALLLLGLYALMHGVYRRFSERGPRDFTIGPDPKARVNMPAEYLPVAAFPLVRSTGRDFELAFTNAMSGDLVVDGQTLSLAELAQSGRAQASSDLPGAHVWPIADHARARLTLAHNTFLIASVPAPRRHEAPLRIDWATHAYTGATGLTVLLFLLLVRTIPADLQSLSLDAFNRDRRFAQFTIAPPDERSAPLPDWLRKNANQAAGGRGQRAEGSEGRMGKKTSHNQSGLYAIKGPKDNVDPRLAKQLAAAQAQTSGVIGILKANQGTQVASIFGRDTALGNDAQDVLSGLSGTQIAEAYGTDGSGLVASGKGGGGPGEATIGLDRLGTVGKGGRGGHESGYGPGGAGVLVGRHASAPEVVPGTAAVRGSLDKELIRRVIRRHLNEVKFCYEKELLRQSSLYGRVTTQFTVGGNGQVLAAVVQGSTLNDSAVEQCIVQSVRRWQFPKPEGGGIVIVSYPFVLKAAGAE